MLEKANTENRGVLVKDNYRTPVTIILEKSGRIMYQCNNKKYKRK
jgi:hypothetical protein